ncbi:IS4 family transposase, partial [Oceanimonas marisflavi]|uniref:IS4 family transposase n=1 Tax=Oceanimonas marisflavi TaxID=2059724 RepID=UPI00130062CA
MPAVRTVCHNFFRPTLSSFHQARTNTLLSCAEGLIAGNTLSLTRIGRHLPGKAKVKHKIKRVDRFIGNKKLHDEHTAISAALARRITACLPSCVIAIDWSGCCSQDFHVLRASLVYDGRGLPLLNRVVPSERQEHTDEHQQFLLDLQSLLGTARRVVIVTDAGFKTPWLRQVRALGWEFVGRVRGRIYGKLDSEQEWYPATGLTQHASATPEALGPGQLGKSVKRRCSVYFHQYHGPAKGRHKKRGKKQPLYPQAEARYRALAKEPWLLVTSDEHLSAKEVVSIYQTRMQIEQNFRDDKSQRYGFGWSNSKTLGEKRIAVLCLIAQVATLMLWLVGFEAEHQGWHRRYQANTAQRRVLSFLTLG